MSSISSRRYAFTTFAQRHIVNPLARRNAAQTLLETKGRTSGKPRLTPLGGRIEGESFWFVSEMGVASQYVKNIQADPRVRVRIRGQWLPGVAVLLPEDDPVARLKKLPGVNSRGVRLIGLDLLTIRVDLDSRRSS